MEIVYCDSCGFRVPDIEFQAGRAVRIEDKVYCQKCKPAPVAATPISARKMAPAGVASSGAPASAHRSSLASTPAAHRRETAHGIHDTALRHREAVPARGGKKNLVPIIGGASAALVLGAVLFFSGSSSKDSPQSRANSGASPASRQSGVREDRTQARGNSGAPAPHPAREASPLLAVDARENAARAAFDAINHAADNTDKPARAAQWQAFLQQYGDAIIAARARTILEKLQREIASGAPLEKTPSAVPLPGSGSSPTPAPNSGKPAIERTPADIASTTGSGSNSKVDPPAAVSSAPTTPPTTPPTSSSPAPTPDPAAAEAAEAAVVDETAEAGKVDLSLFNARIAYARYQDEALEWVRKLDAERLASCIAKFEAEEASKPLASEIAADKKLVAMLKDFEAAVQRGVARLKDEDEVELRLYKGAPIRVGRKADFQLAAFKDGTLTLSNKGMSMPVSLDALQLESRKRLALLDAGADAKGFMRRAFVELLEAGPRSMDQARTYLERAKAGKAPAEDQAVVARWIDANEEGVTENAAKGAFAELAALGGQRNIPSLTAGLRQFEAAFAGTAVAAKNAAEIAKLSTMADRPGALGRYYKYKYTPKGFMDIKPDTHCDLIRADAEINFPPKKDTYLAGRKLALVHVEWTGMLTIKDAGQYTFFLESDDGSRLYIDGKKCVDDSGSHSMVERNGKVELAAGRHHFKLEYFNSAQSGGIIWRWQPPNGEKAVVPTTVLSHRLAEQ